MKKHLAVPAFVAIGSYAIVVQVLCIREFMVVFFGNELCLGIILACWLIGIASGAAIGGAISKRAAVTSLMLSIYLIITSLLPFIQIYFIRLIRKILLIPPGEYINLFYLIASTFVLILPFSFMIGFIFPAGCKLLGERESNSASSIGWIYIAEALGSLIGGIFLTFYMIQNLSPFEIISLLSLFIVLMSLLLSSIEKRRTAFITALSSLLLLAGNLFLLFSGNMSRLDNLLVGKRWEAYGNNLELTVSLNSRYQNIVLAVQNDQYSLFGNGQGRYLITRGGQARRPGGIHRQRSVHPTREGAGVTCS